MLAAGEERLRVIVEANLRGIAPEWSEAKRAQAAVFIAGGFMGLLRWWTDGGLTQTPAAMEAAFIELSVRY
jgi:hypothetical protein